MSRVNKETAEEMAEAAKLVRIEEVVLDYVPLDRAFCPCPFHDDEGKNLVILVDIQRYRCMVCDAAGDALDFVMRYEGITKEKAVEQLAWREVGRIDAKTRPECPGPNLIAMRRREVAPRDPSVDPYAAWRDKPGAN